VRRGELVLARVVFPGVCIPASFKLWIFFLVTVLEKLNGLGLSWDFGLFGRIFLALLREWEGEFRDMQTELTELIRENVQQ